MLVAGSLRNISMALVSSLALASSAAAMNLQGAEAASPALIWRDVSRINVLCLVNSDSPDRQTLEKTLCDRALTLAKQGAPAPVRVIAIGDPTVLAAGEVTLLIHASVQTMGKDDRLMAFSVRPFRASVEQTAVLFGAAPRAAKISSNYDNLDHALNAAFSELLPWRTRPAAARPIP